MSANVGSLQSYIPIPRLTTGRRLFVLQSMLAIACKRGEQAIIDALQESIEFDRHTLLLEEQWKTVRDNRSTRRGDASVIDNALDQAINSVATVARGHASGDPKKPRPVAANTILQTLFPNGVSAITQQSFEEQLESVVLFLSKCLTLEDEIRLLGLEDRVAEIGELTTRFRIELEKTPKGQVTWDQVRAAYNEGHERYLSIHALILGKYWRRDVEHTALREEIFAEHNRQIEIVQDKRRRKVPVLDVHPDTGEEIGDPVAEEIEAGESGIPAA